MSFDIIFLLNKQGLLSVTSLLPNPTLCSPCQLAKSKRLPFELNNNRASFVLDIIHCDLWGPAPTVSPDGFLYYVIFVDDSLVSRGYMLCVASPIFLMFSHNSKHLLKINLIAKSRFFNLMEALNSLTID